MRRVAWLWRRYLAGAAHAHATVTSDEGAPVWGAFLHTLRWIWCRWVPLLVWRGDSVEVKVSFPGIAQLGGSPLRDTAMFTIEQDLHDLGVEFDTGSGRAGREWMLDWSRGGPIEVTFIRRRGRCAK